MKWQQKTHTGGCGGGSLQGRRFRRNSSQKQCITCRLGYSIYDAIRKQGNRQKRWSEKYWKKKTGHHFTTCPVSKDQTITHSRHLAPTSDTIRSIPFRMTANKISGIIPEIREALKDEYKQEVEMSLWDIKSTMALELLAAEFYRVLWSYVKKFELKKNIKKCFQNLFSTLCKPNRLRKILLRTVTCIYIYKDNVSLM